MFVCNFTDTLVTRLTRVWVFSSIPGAVDQLESLMHGQFPVEIFLHQVWLLFGDCFYCALIQRDHDVSWSGRETTPSLAHIPLPCVFRCLPFWLIFTQFVFIIVLHCPLPAHNIGPINFPSSSSPPFPGNLPYIISLSILQ